MMKAQDCPEYAKRILRGWRGLSVLGCAPLTLTRFSGMRPGLTGL